MTWIPKTAIDKVTFNLMQFCVHTGIRFPYLSECHRQIPFLESMSLDYVLSQLVLIKENKTKVFIALRVVGPSKQLKQIIQIEHNTVKNPNNQENLYNFFSSYK